MDLQQRSISELLDVVHKILRPEMKNLLPLSLFYALIVYLITRFASGSIMLIGYAFSGPTLTTSSLPTSVLVNSSSLSIWVFILQIQIFRVLLSYVRPIIIHKHFGTKPNVLFSYSILGNIVYCVTFCALLALGLYLENYLAHSAYNSQTQKIIDILIFLPYWFCMEILLTTLYAIKVFPTPTPITYQKIFAIIKTNTIRTILLTCIIICYFCNILIITPDYQIIVIKYSWLIEHLALPMILGFILLYFALFDDLYILQLHNQTHGHELQTRIDTMQQNYLGHQTQQTREPALTLLK